MAGAALLRSAASKIVRAPPRLLVQEGLQHHGRRLLGREPSYRLSSYSTSGASTPLPTNHRGPQTHNKKVPNEWDCAKAAAMEILPKAAYVMAFGGWMFICFWSNPKLDQIKDSLEEKLAMEDEIKRNHQRLCGLLDSKEGQFEARDSVVRSRVKQEDLYDPVQVLKGKVNPIQVNLTKEEEWMTKLKVVFTLHDKNRDGFITTEELEDLLVFLGKRYSESVLKDIITKADVDLNRGVDFTQFLQIMENKDKDEEVETALKLTDNEDVRCVPGSQTCAVGKPRREAPGGRAAYDE